MSLETVIAMMGVTLLLCACMWLLLRAVKKRINACNNAVQVLQADSLAQHADAATQASRFEQFERQLQYLSRRQNQLELRDPVTQTYEPAIRMVRSGADVEELVSTCGLARAEAELIMMLHRNVVGPEAAHDVSDAEADEVRWSG
ncbi:MAG: DUF2802 domain-containing protein [Gammaproteobacteria bacterium]|nr:DUF2802 domain-containing protein [Gammaproteobacteria bacterium]